MMPALTAPRRPACGEVSNALEQAEQGNCGGTVYELGGLDAATVEAASQRRSYKAQPVDAESLAEQQRIADAFTQAQVLPRKVSIADSPVWRPAA